MSVGFDSSSSINGVDEMVRYKFFRLSRVGSIEDGVLRFYHIAHEEEGLLNIRCLIFIEHLR